MDSCIVNRQPLRRTVVFKRSGHQAALIDKRYPGPRRYELQLLSVPPAVGELFHAAFRAGPTPRLQGKQHVTLTFDFDQLDALRDTARARRGQGDTDPFVAQLADASIARGAVACLLAALHPALVGATLVRLVLEVREGRPFDGALRVRPSRASRCSYSWELSITRPLR